MKKIQFGENKNVIWKHLKLCRIKNGLTQAELAAKLQTMGVSIDQQMISKIENNTRIVTDYELVCFALALNVEINELVEIAL